MPRVQKVLTQADPEVTLSPNAAGALSSIVKVAVPRGLAMVFPGRFPLVLKLKDSDGAELPDDSRIYFGIKKPGQPDFVHWFSARVLYEPWGNLTLAQQRNSEWEEAVTLDMQIPFLALVEEEELHIGVVSSSVAATAQVHFAIPYVERAAGEVGEELALRVQWIGV